VTEESENMSIMVMIFQSWSILELDWLYFHA
jgi:hypothetical protein